MSGHPLAEDGRWRLVSQSVAFRVLEDISTGQRCLCVDTSAPAAGLADQSHPSRALGDQSRATNHLEY